MTNTYSFKVNQAHLRLDQYLVEKLPDYSRSKIQNYIRRGQVVIDGKIGRPSMKLQGNEAVECYFEVLAVDKSIIRQNIPIDIIYEDKDIVVINKPSGLVVHPGNGNHDGTLLNGLLYHFDTLSKEDSVRPGIVHRLDKDTSGVILIAKNDRVHNNLSEQFSSRTVKKEYIAIIWGTIDSKGVIEGNIGRNPRNRQTYTMVELDGKQSKTKFHLEEYFPPFSLVRLLPETGRTHQLRVHMKYIGHPIFGDTAYSGGIKYAKSFHMKYTKLIHRINKIIPRVALHAKTLEIIHPSTEKKMVFDAPLPIDFMQTLDILKNE